LNPCVYARWRLYFAYIEKHGRPPLTRYNITETAVEKAKAPKTGEVFYRDREIRGFGLRVNFGGVRSFILEGRIHGRVRRMTLGRWPELPVVKAKKKALEWKAAIAEGKDPTATAPGEQSTSFKALATRYLDHVKAHGKKSARRDEQMLALYVSKGWAKRRLIDIARDEVVRLHEAVGAEHGHYSANRLIALLRGMFNVALDWKLFAGENPASRIKMFKEEKRERFLSPDELKRVNDALMQEPSEYWRAYFPLSCMLGTRRSELLSARWADVDLEQRTWRLPMTKAGRSHLLPLPAPAIAIIESLPSRGKSEWIFPGTGKTGHIIEPKAAWQRIRTRAGVPDVRIHDLRRTLGSWLAAAGFSLPAIGRALNHASPVSTAVYARLALDPVRTMLEANAAAMFGAGIAK
jgi:integrase